MEHVFVLLIFENLECPNNCSICSSGVCKSCKWPYTIKNALCFEDINCMKYDYIFDNYGNPIDTDC